MGEAGAVLVLEELVHAARRDARCGAITVSDPDGIDRTERSKSRGRKCTARPESGCWWQIAAGMLVAATSAGVATALAGYKHVSELRGVVAADSGKLALDDELDSGAPRGGACSTSQHARKRRGMRSARRGQPREPHVAPFSAPQTAYLSQVREGTAKALWAPRSARLAFRV